MATIKHKINIFKYYKIVYTLNFLIVIYNFYMEVVFIKHKKKIVQFSCKFDDTIWD